LERLGVNCRGVRLPARDLATRLGLDQSGVAQALYRTTASATNFWRGYRWAAAFHEPDTPVGVERPGAPSALEAYFDSYAEGPGIFKWRHYFDIYDRHLRRFRAQPITLVEIGVAGGGSLAMWREYLGPDAHIVGIDIDEGCRTLASENTEIVIGDQGDPAFWAEFLAAHPRVDVVIDDGGHHPEQQVTTLRAVLGAIEPGGVYICEDIHGSFQPFHAFVDGLTRELSDIGFAHENNPASSFQRAVESVHRYPLVVVIEKRAWSPTTIEAEHRGTDWPDAWDVPSGG